MIFKCPGAQKIRQAQPEILKCPFCSEEVEIWTDENRAKCTNCKQVVTRQMGQNCLDWCKYAKECVGHDVYDKHMKSKTATIKQQLLKELKEYFGNDSKRINHAEKVMSYAEELLRSEKGDWHIVIPTSVLHDVGIREAERKYGSSAGHYQEKEGPLIAEKILLKVELKKEDIDEICEIIAHHHTPGKVNTQNFKILYDSDWLVNIKDEVDLKNKARVKEVINKVFLTKTGKKMAEKLYLLKKGVSHERV